MRKQGVTDDFAKRALATLPTTVWVPTADELRQGHVVTGGDRAFATPSFRPDWPDVADRMLLNHPLYQALRKAEPDSYAALRDEKLRVMQSGVYGIESKPTESLMTAAFGILIMQDLVVGPLIVGVLALSRGPESVAAALGLAARQAP